MISLHRPLRWQTFAAWVIFAIGVMAVVETVFHLFSVQDTRRVVTVWHPLRPPERALLEEEFRRFEASHPDVRVRGLFKDIEELRSAYEAAALAGVGPDLVYGPSDVLDTFQTMGILQDMGPWFSDAERADFIKGALTFLPNRVDPTKHDLVQVGDRFGTHLALIYNRQFVPEPPKTTDELVAIAVANTVDVDGDGHNERYGLVWSFSEPFFAIPFLTGHGAWVFGGTPDAPTNVPALDTPQCAAAFRFMQSLRDVHHVTPANCDYELADTLFKSGRAAMIINGDWSWNDYLRNPDIDAAIAVLPIVSATGLPMQPMIAPKGFSLNANSSPAAAKDAMAFVRHMTDIGAQRRIAERSGIIPARLSVYDESLAVADPNLRISQLQLANGRLMPVARELRAVWDAMRPAYQALLGGTLTPEAAVAQIQRDALHKIDLMHQQTEPGYSALFTETAAILSLVAWLYWQRKSFIEFARDWHGNRIAYLFAIPAIVVIFFVIIFPFFYNIVLSLSDMSLYRFKNWRIVGLQNYAEVLGDPTPWWIFGQTVIWTVVNVAIQVGLGVMLAVTLNGPIRGKAIYSVLLIIPWAVPAYITALTWRGMFDYEYGAVNLLLESAAHMPPFAWLLRAAHITPPINWLGDPLGAFVACIVANVWLGFPFMMVIALGGLQGIPRDLYEAAQIDRASRWQQFRHITLPLLKPVLIPAITLGAIWTFNNLNVIWLVSNGGEPQDRTHILVSYVYKSVFNLYRYGYGAALSMIIFLVLLAFAWVFLRKTRATENVYG